MKYYTIEDQDKIPFGFFIKKEERDYAMRFVKRYGWIGEREE